jgi:hypothetical protein
MKPKIASHYWLLLAFLFLPLLLCAAESTYQSGKIVDLQRKTRSRILYYQVDTPVTQDDPYYEISVQLNKVVYTGDYAPRHAADTLPEDWKTGTDVSIRLEKHYMFLQRPEGRELQFTLVKHKAAPLATPAVEVAPPQPQ